MRRPWWSFVPSFAAVLLAVFALMLWRENSSLRRRLDQVASRGEDVTSAAKLQNAGLVMEALTSPDSSHFTLVASKSQPVPEARVSYMEKTGTLVLTAQHLRPLPPRKAYELWLIPASGSAPMPFGTFAPDAQGNAFLVTPKSNRNATPKMFAVTIEPEGGSETPTMPIVMSGI
jgi:anti-sigma-K factor RskA